MSDRVCINPGCGKPRYPYKKWCSVDCKRILEGKAAITTDPASAAKLQKRESKPTERITIAPPAPARQRPQLEEPAAQKRQGTTSLDQELELRSQGYSTVTELAREFNRSGPGLFVLLQQKKVTKKTVPGIRAAFYNVAEAVQRIGPKGSKQKAEPELLSTTIADDNSARDFERDAAELDQALVRAGRTDLVEKPATGGGVNVHTNVHTRRRTPRKVADEFKIRPLTKLLAQQAIICERSGLHEAERVLLWMTLKSAGALKGNVLRN